MRWLGGGRREGSRDLETDCKDLVEQKMQVEMGRERRVSRVGFGKKLAMMRDGWEVRRLWMAKLA